MLFLIYFQFLTLTDLFKQWKSKTMLQTKEKEDLDTVTVTRPYKTLKTATRPVTKL